MNSCLITHTQSKTATLYFTFSFLYPFKIPIRSYVSKALHMIKFFFPVVVALLNLASLAIAAPIESATNSLNVNCEKIKNSTKKKNCIDEYEKKTAEIRAEELRRIEEIQEKEFIIKAKNQITKDFKDPDSVLFRNIVIFKDDLQNRTMCGELNAKNSYGGYIGYAKFYSDSFGENWDLLIKKTNAIGEDEVEIEEITNKIFDKMWSINCQNDRANGIQRVDSEKLTSEYCSANGNIKAWEIMTEVSKISMSSQVQMAKITKKYSDISEAKKAIKQFEKNQKILEANKSQFSRISFLYNQREQTDDVLKLKCPTR